MEFGSAHAYADIYHDQEDIYEDEIVDGIASCAQEQVCFIDSMTHFEYKPNSILLTDFLSQFD